MRLTVSLRFSPDASLRVGTLFDLGRDVAFEYDRAFLATGLNIAPFRLPPQRGVVVYDRSGNMDTFGAFEDSLPDGWGRRLMDIAYRRRHGRLPTVLERLACVGVNGRGALVYEPEEPMEVESDFGDLATLAQSAMDFDAGKAEDVLPEVRFNPQTGEVCAERDVLPPGFEHWIVKFNTRKDGSDAGLREYRYYEKAIAAGVQMMPSRFIETRAGGFFATKRFAARTTADGSTLRRRPGFSMRTSERRATSMRSCSS